MSESFRHDFGDRDLPSALDAPGGPDAPRPSTAARLGAEWGLASLLMGGVLFLCCPIMLIFNWLCYSGSSSALAGSDLKIARVASVVVYVAVIGFGGAALGFGVRAWMAAVAHRQPQGLPIAGVLTSGVGLLLWLMVGADTLAIMFDFF
jgi:hypothetical protein